MDEGYVSNGDIKLHYIADGPVGGEPVLMLHGFPQFSYEWRHQIQALSAAGYRVVAPDLRGYNLSDRPTGIEAYRLQNLVTDVTAFYQHFGWSQANLVVHDWGGAVGWIFVTYQPQLVKRFVAIDIPHPVAFSKVLRENTEQLQLSWYIWFFQTAEVPERVFGGENIERFIHWFFQKHSTKAIFSPEELARYREMLLRPGQLTAAMNYYRANSTPERLLGGKLPQMPLVQVPTLLLYGKDDFAFAPSVWQESANNCAGPFRLVGLDGLGHWLPEEAPAEVNRLLLEYLKS